MLQTKLPWNWFAYSFSPPSNEKEIERKDTKENILAK